MRAGLSLNCEGWDCLRQSTTLWWASLRLAISLALRCIQARIRSNHLRRNGILHHCQPKWNNHPNFDTLWNTWALTPEKEAPTWLHVLGTWQAHNDTPKCFESRVLTRFRHLYLCTKTNQKHKQSLKSFHSMLKLSFETFWHKRLIFLAADSPDSVTTKACHGENSYFPWSCFLSTWHEVRMHGCCS